MSVRRSFWRQRRILETCGISKSLNISVYIYPPLVLDVIHLYLDIGTKYMVFSLPDVTMRMLLPICESFRHPSKQFWHGYSVLLPKDYRLVSRVGFLVNPPRTG